MVSKLSFPFSCVLFLVFYVSYVFSHFQYPHLEPNGFLVNNTDLSPFGFLKNMQGCGKGDNVKGIRDLKRYLGHFGYLDYQNTPDVMHLGEDHFDDELEKALKSYQAFYHLNATGKIDGPTISKMVMPRCGFPDKETHQHSNNSLYTVSHYQFFPGSPKWPKGKRHLTYAFRPGFPARFIPPVARAFRKWAVASRYFTFSWVRTYRGADLKISFERRFHGDGSPFDGVLAHAFPPTDGRFHYNTHVRWVNGAVRNAYDVESVALHEIGHLLGLGHSQFQKAIMWATFAPGVTKHLNSDDIQGIRSLYGS